MAVSRKPPTPVPECYRHPPLEAFCRVWAQQGHVPDEREEREARQLSLSYREKFTQFGKGLTLGCSVGDVVANLGLAAAEPQ